MKEARRVNTRSLLLSVLILSSSVLQAFAHYHPDEGRWLSRDPIGDKGGLNEYAWCHNAGTDLIDLLGLKWSVYRRNGAYADAYRGDPGDTIEDLAKIVELDAAESEKWLTKKTTLLSLMGKDNGCWYEVPNTVYITYGNMRTVYAMGLLVDDASNTYLKELFMAGASKMEWQFSRRGYRVVNASEGVDAGGNPLTTHKAALGSRDIAIWGFFGHGTAPGGIFIGDNGKPGGVGITGISTSYLPSVFRAYQHHRLQKVVMFACEQAAPSLLPAWKDMISDYGMFYGSDRPLVISPGLMAYWFLYWNPSMRHSK